MDHRYLGTQTELGRVVLDSLGQKIRLEDAAAIDAMKGGCVIIPEAEYQKLGITPDEATRYRYPGARGSAPAEVKAKLAKGIAVYDRILNDAAMGFPPQSAPAEETK